MNHTALRKAVIVAAIALLTTGVRASEPQKTFEKIQYGNEVYENVTVKRSTATHVTIRHKYGIATLDFRGLPEDVRVSMGYDEGKAREGWDRAHEAEERRRKHEAQQAFIRKLDESAHEMRFEVIQVLPRGLLAEGMTGYQSFPEGPPMLNDGRPNAWRLNGRIHFVRLYPGKNLARGDRISGRFARHGTYSYEAASGGRQTVPQQIFTRKE